MARSRLGTIERRNGTLSRGSLISSKIGGLEAGTSAPSAYFIHYVGIGCFTDVKPVLSRTISRRYSTPLRNGHKTAQLFTESTVYKFVKDPELAAPRKWFQAWADHILHIYGIEHAIQKGDLMLGKSCVPL